MPGKRGPFGRVIKAIKNTLIYWSVKIAMAVFSILPLAFLRMKFGFLGYIVARLPIKLNRIAKENLEAVFPEKSPAERKQILLDCYSALGRCAAEVLKVGLTDMKPSTVCRFSPGTRELFESAVEAGTGAIFITGHIGNWELMASYTAEQGFPVFTIAKESYDPRFTGLIRRFRESKGVHCLWKGDPDIKEKIIGVFLSGALLGVLLDQDTKVPGVFADFFGRKAFTASLPAVIAVKAGLPVFSAFTHRDTDGMNVVTVKKLDTSVPEGVEPVVYITNVFNRAIEENIRKYPHEWVWMHERWKTRPRD